MNVIITGYYKKDNFGDDLFELIADKLFQNDKFKKQICNYEIIPITQLVKRCKNNNWRHKVQQQQEIFSDKILFS